MIGILTLSLAAISFQISNFQKSPNYYSIDVQLSGTATGSAYYIQAMFTPLESNSYFGFTWGQKGDWLKYISSPEKEYIKSNFPLISDDKIYQVLLKPDIDSSKYQGSGEYLLKVKRYTGESSSGYYSDNSLTVSLAESTPTPEVTPTSSPTATITSAPTATPILTSTPSPASVVIRTPTATPTKTMFTSTPSITITLPLAETPTPSEESEILGSSVSAEIEPATYSAKFADLKGETETNSEFPKAVVILFITGALILVIFWRLRILTRPIR